MEAIDGYVTKLRTMSHRGPVSGQGSVLKPSMGHPVGKNRTAEQRPSFAVRRTKAFVYPWQVQGASVQNNALRDGAEPDEGRGDGLERATAPWCTVSPGVHQGGDSTQDPPPG
ncbi:hypothetical protein AAFF_G00082270 [Aldrovandia affinis]|uniref:Uncharacterized protein n=1 Tax=Aldrovandia affinis TaxID=143900 RepID=A0AAD7T3G8_9TELE|nr:hypothetical protein AAFF_G00082270 [Aldrovandia affinis]